MLDTSLYIYLCILLRPSKLIFPQIDFTTNTQIPAQARSGKHDDFDQMKVLGLKPIFKNASKQEQSREIRICCLQIKYQFFLSLSLFIYPSLRKSSFFS